MREMRTLWDGSPDEGRAPPSSNAMDSRAGSASVESWAMRSSIVSGVVVMGSQVGAFSLTCPPAQGYGKDRLRTAGTGAWQSST